MNKLLLISLTLLSLSSISWLLYPLRKIKILVITLVPILAIFLTLSYSYWGAWTDLQQYNYQQEKQLRVQAMLQTIKSPIELIERLKNRLAQDPKSSRGWYLLGRLYVSQNNWLSAKKAFAKAQQLDPDNENILVNYAQTLWEINQQQFDKKIDQLFKKLLEKNPNQPDALAMLAMDAFKKQNYQVAINYWQHLLQLAPSQSEEAQVIRRAIAKAQSLLSR